MNQNSNFLTIKTTINDIETKADKNFNPYFKLTLAGYTDYFYAFSFNLSEKTNQTLSDSPYKLVNQSALITYEELPNKDGNGNFFRVKEVELLKEGY